MNIFVVFFLLQLETLTQPFQYWHSVSKTQESLQSVNGICFLFTPLNRGSSMISKSMPTKPKHSLTIANSLQSELYICLIAFGL